MSQSKPPAIVRANNPCALRPLGQGRWKGQVGTIRTKGGQYCAFSGSVWGVRAGLRNLDTYRRIHGLTTPAQIIGRWAPAHDANPQAAYTRFIAKRLGIGVYEPISSDYESIRRLVTAIVRFECGYDAVGVDTVAQAMAVMATEERRHGRDPAPYLSDGVPLKPLTRSKEIALGGGAATAGIGGVLAYGREAIDVGREALDVGRNAAGGATEAIATATGPASNLACIGSFLVLIVFGLGVLANRLRARLRAER